MYGKYWYRSGINVTMANALRDVVEATMQHQYVKEGDVWLDIACNDGTLLGFVPKRCMRVGVDPAEDSFKWDAVKNCNLHIQEFFSKDVYRHRLGTQRAKVVTSIAMFYDVPDPRGFMKDVYDILEDDGLWVMQLSYAPLMIRQMAFDNICHEHIWYYTLENLKYLLKLEDFQVVDCELNDVNGGSMRLYIRKGKWVNTNPVRDVQYFRVESLLALEQELGMSNPETWKYFFKRIETMKKNIIELVREIRTAGQTVWAYGASTKGNTLLQYFGLDNMLIDAVADRNPSKHGLRTIGTNIPIKSEEEMRAVKPDYLLILPWHFIEEFREREREYLKNGGKFIVPCPKFQVITG